jgi:hypothetical protein
MFLPESYGLFDYLGIRKTVKNNRINIVSNSVDCPMPKTTKTTVTQNSEGQYQTTIPKALGDAMNLEGEKVEWEVKSGNKLEVKVVNE